MGSVGAKRSSTSASALDLDNMSNADARARISAMQQAMGQTGDEAGNPNAPSRQKLYVATSKSFNINAYLMSDGKTMHSDNSSWDSLGYTERMVRNDIKKIDAGMKPLSEGVQTYRYIDGGGLKRMLGLHPRTDVKQLIKDLANGDAAATKLFNQALDQEYTHKGYSSFTYKQSHSTFDSRDVKMKITLSKGTPAIVTNNHAEAEILGARNLKYNFQKKWSVQKTRRGTNQLVLEIVI